MSNKIDKVMDGLMNAKKKGFFSYLFYGVLLLFLAIGVLGKVIFTSLVFKKKRLE